MPKTEEQVAMGQRLQAAARQAGIGADQIARHLGVKAPTVYRWWAGERTPSTPMLLAYARLMGKPVGYFYGQDAAEECPRELAQWLLRWVQGVTAGEKPGAAFDRVFGEPGELTPRARPPVAAVMPPMRRVSRRVRVREK